MNKPQNQPLNKKEPLDLILEKLLKLKLFSLFLVDQRIKELERENAELREEAEILKKAAAFLADAMRK